MFGALFWSRFRFVLYVAVSLPREDRVVESLQPWILGVCSKIALRTDLEVGIVRFLAIALSIMSFGSTLVGYFVLYFVMEDKPARVLSSEIRLRLHLQPRKCW